ncbi:MAG: ABC transporter permease [Alphaproteobacteria bacterium]|nr:ABC transporter permease [Alphaproteobacteria bacterium]
MLKHQKNNVQVVVQNNAAKIILSGDVLECDSDNIVQQVQKFSAENLKSISFEAQTLEKWDSSLLVILYETLRVAQANGINVNMSDLPQNLQDLMKLAFADDRKPTHDDSQFSWLESLGKKIIDLWETISQVCKFLGKTTVSVGKFLSGQSIMRGVDFYSALNDCGPKALAIVSLISFLVGLILAFVGAVQLQTFGAQIYVASLVTIGMCRIMGAIMVGIIMAGRTGSSYAATIGTMQVNEELDALQTMGMPATDFLVLPRLLALVLAMPILTMLSDIMGMIGGAFIGVFMMQIPYQEYWKYAFDAFTLKNFLVGIFHGFCFGIIIALCGCYSGLHCGRNADSVGLATTKSVVCAIVWMIVVTGIITIICQELGL